jgi:transcriptional regulator with PAS, ATPase and Fis domain
LCIEGETGCGKEYVSRTLHRHSRWRSGKFVAINCAAIPESLMNPSCLATSRGVYRRQQKRLYR